MKRVVDRFNEILVWADYNRPNDNAPLEARAKYLDRAFFTVMEMNKMLLEELLRREFGERSANKIVVPSGVKLHEAIREDDD